MKKRDSFPYRPHGTRLAPEHQMVDLERVAKAAFAALGEPSGAVAVIVVRPTGNDLELAMHSGVIGRDERALARLAEAGPGNLDDFLDRHLRGKGTPS